MGAAQAAMAAQLQDLAQAQQAHFQPAAVQIQAPAIQAQQFPEQLRPPGDHQQNIPLAQDPSCNLQPLIAPQAVHRPQQPIAIQSQMPLQQILGISPELAAQIKVALGMQAPANASGAPLKSRATGSIGLKPE